MNKSVRTSIFNQRIDHRSAVFTVDVVTVLPFQTTQMLKLFFFQIRFICLYFRANVCCSELIPLTNVDLYNDEFK